MRDPNRIKFFCDEFAYYWREYASDMRFGQLCLNFFSWLQNERGIDPWFLEENEMSSYLKEYVYYK